VRRILTLAALRGDSSLGTRVRRRHPDHGGPIHTGVAAAPSAQAVLIRDDRILFVGDLASAKAKAAKTPRHRPEGRGGLPGSSTPTPT